MKPVLLYGPAKTSSRKKLSDIKSGFDLHNTTVFEKGADPKDILENLVTISMFVGDRLVVLENPNEEFLTNPVLNNSQAALVVWFDKELKKLPPNWQILFFPEAKEVSIFPLLDLLAAGKKEAFLELRKLKNLDTQYLITMIFYLLRSLVATPKNAPSFVRNKLAKQRARFKEGELAALYRFVLEVDFKIKSGLLENDQADFLLINRFLGETY